MPYEDKTGPEGKGPKTGRGFGICTEEVEYIESIEPIRRGRGFGFGRGFGLGRGFGPRRGPEPGRRFWRGRFWIYIHNQNI